MARTTPDVMTFGETIATFGFREAASLLGRKGGRRKSKAKTEAARENGKLGGRPRKPKSTNPKPDS